MSSELGWPHKNTRPAAGALIHELVPNPHQASLKANSNEVLCSSQGRFWWPDALGFSRRWPSERGA